MNFDPCIALVNEGVTAGAYPGAAYAIGCGREVYASGVVGSRTLVPSPEPLSRGTLFDLASLSKLVSTTMVALRFLEEGRLLLSDPLSRFFTPDELEGAPEGRADVTVFRLMTHSSGITPGVALWRVSPSASDSDVAHTILASAPFCAPGEQVYYSCMGYILLQKILERISGRSLDKLAEEYVFSPLGLTHTCYCPKSDDVVTTELSPHHGYYVKGHVHDENAHFLGGVSGNAGVFSDLDDMIRFTQMCATRGELPDGNGRFLARRTFELAVKNYTPGLNEARGLGFQLRPPLPGLSACGDLFAEGSFGHTGFTGTSAYVDAETGLWGILLTNAVHLGRENKGDYFRRRRLFYNALTAAAGRD